MTTKSIVAATVTSLLALGGLAGTAGAADEKATEKCYGIVKAGANDCAGKAHACQGQAKKDRDAKEYIALPKGTCERIAGGSLAPK
ncbi:MAG TPA: DUF2282 domain-containing protein [Steroidobacteraceae bacterium]|nr:DUF2282 domain-containing protein [Steroidobacteraceae bacterium]